MLLCHHQTINMGSGESHFNVLLIVRAVTRQGTEKMKLFFFLTYKNKQITTRKQKLEPAKDHQSSGEEKEKERNR